MDFELYGEHGISFADDTMEGSSHTTDLISTYLFNILKSKLSLKDDASPLDGGSKSKLKLGLFSYPVLQAADILVHRATHVPVGEDQSQHLEFARECVTNFNHAYGSRLVFPQTIMCTSPISSPIQTNLV